MQPDAIAYDSQAHSEALDYVRGRYGVPAFLDRRVTVYTGAQGHIIGGEGGRILVLLDGETHPRRYHPTWRVEYHEARPIS